MQFWKLRKTEDGAVLVEAAIVLPILLLVVWVIIDFARAFYTVNSLASAVREGARLAAVYEDPVENESAIKARVIAAFNPLIGKPLEGKDILIREQTITEGGVPVRVVTVRVEGYDWVTTTPITFFGSDGKWSITREATFRWERDPT